jgi:hypothetical protein
MVKPRDRFSIGLPCNLNASRGDARKGQEKGNVSDVGRIAKYTVPKLLNSRYLTDTASRVCATDPLVLPRGRQEDLRKRKVLEANVTSSRTVLKDCKLQDANTVQAAPMAVTS